MGSLSYMNRLLNRLVFEIFIFKFADRQTDTSTDNNNTDLKLAAREPIGRRAQSRKIKKKKNP